MATRGKRDLSKDELGGVIFSCTNLSKCLKENKFSVPGLRGSSNLPKIDKGLPLFLFHKTKRNLHGIYEAVSTPHMNFELHVTEVDVCERMACQPLTEAEFKPIILENYLGFDTFGCELDHQQTAQLLVKFSEKACATEEISTGENINRNYESSPRNQSAINAQIFDGMRELYGCHEEQNKKLNQVVQRLERAGLGLLMLEDRADVLQSINSLMTKPEAQDDCDFQGLDSDEPIHLVGGFDGSSCLSRLSTYYPSRDLLISLKPMEFPRSNMGVAKLFGEFYVLGGRNTMEGSVYDKVESYNAVFREWNSRPSLKESKCQLAAASVDNKIYAVGGRNAKAEIVSTVEMFDTGAEQWISASAMRHQRADLGAAELNGILYAVGGYDESIKYLQSAERYDPREPNWTEIKGMNTPRCAHSLVVLNGDLMAIGGFNGTEVISTVEIYDIRKGWYDGDPMNLSRGNAAADVLKDEIYVIGGSYSKEDMTSTVERYVKGEGWKFVKNFRGPGKWCQGSAVVVEL